MDKNILKGKWKEIKGGIEHGENLRMMIAEVEGKQEKLMGLLQKKYNIQRIRRKRTTFMAR
jgi:uncharacterized protein YjbJ (UPF0337 family)